jgi:hypothetical protein
MQYKETPHYRYKQRLNERTQEGAKHTWKRWEPDEIAYLLESDEKLEEIARVLGRTYKGCNEKRKKLRRGRRKESRMECPMCGSETRYMYWPKNFSPSGRLEDISSCYDVTQCGWEARYDRATGQLIKESTRKDRVDKDGWEKVPNLSGRVERKPKGEKP